MQKEETLLLLGLPVAASVEQCWKQPNDYGTGHQLAECHNI